MKLTSPNPTLFSLVYLPFERILDQSYMINYVLRFLEIARKILEGKLHSKQKMIRVQFQEVLQSKSISPEIEEDLTQIRR